MAIDQTILPILNQRGFEYTESESRKIIKNFDKSDTSTLLYNYLKEHPSFRATFNALIKTGIFDLNSTLEKLPDLLKGSGDSFVHKAYCKNKSCKQILDSPHVLDNGKQFRRKTITCGSCNSRNVITSNSYLPDFNPGLNDLIRVLLHGCEKKIFLPIYNFWCYHCESPMTQKDNAPFKIKCSKCNKFRFLFTGFAPIDEHLQNIMNNKQGYWLEWYTWRVLKEEYPSEFGLELRKNKNSFQSDIIASIKNKLIIIECKDSSSDDSFLKKLPLIDEAADYFILVSTAKFREDILIAAKRILQGKFLYVSSDKIESIPELIANLN